MTTRTTEPEPCPRLGRLVRGFALASVVANAVRTSWIVLAGLGVQAAIGYAQYLSHPPAGLVWVHVGISVVLWILGLRRYLSTRKGGSGDYASATVSRGYAIAPAA